jgi:hypothetical protein
MDHFDPYLTHQLQIKTICSIIGSIERILKAVKQILKLQRFLTNKIRKTWVKSNF